MSGGPETDFGSRWTEQRLSSSCGLSDPSVVVAGGKRVYEGLKNQNYSSM
jgi:hypothetical protein